METRSLTSSPTRRRRKVKLPKKLSTRERVTLIALGLVATAVVILIPLMYLSISHSKGEESYISHTEEVILVSITNSGPIDLRFGSGVTFSARLSQYSTNPVVIPEYLWIFSDGTQNNTFESTIYHNFNFDPTSIPYWNVTVFVNTSVGVLNASSTVSSYLLNNMTFVLPELPGFILLNCTETSVLLQVGTIFEIPLNSSVLAHNNTQLTDCPYLLRKVVDVTIISNDSEIIVNLTTEDATLHDAFHTAMFDLELPFVPPTSTASLQRRSASLQTLSNPDRKRQLFTEYNPIGDFSLEIASITVPIGQGSVVLHDFNFTFAPKLTWQTFWTQSNVLPAPHWTFEAQGDLIANFLLDLNYIQADGISTVDLYQHIFCPKGGCWQFIGWIPFKYTPSFTLSLGVSLDQVPALQFKNLQVETKGKAMFRAEDDGGNHLVPLRSDSPFATNVTGLEDSIQNCSLQFSVQVVAALGLSVVQDLISFDLEQTVGLYNSFSYPATPTLLDTEHHNISTFCPSNNSTYVYLRQPYSELNFIASVRELTAPINLWNTTLDPNPVCKTSDSLAFLETQSRLGAN